jgi:hypothetical protein
MKKSRKIPRSRRAATVKKAHVAEFFDDHPELETIREMMRECAPSFLEAVRLLAKYSLYPRRFVRVSANSESPSELSTTDIRAGAAVLGFSTPETVHPELVSMAKLRKGELWAVSCLLIPLPGIEGKPDLLVHVLCDHEGHLAACINSELGMRWSTYEDGHSAKTALPLDWRHEHDFFVEAAGRFTAEFAGFTPDCPFDIRELAEELAAFLAREMRVFADIEVHEAATVLGMLMGTRQSALEATEDLAKKLQSAKDSEVKLKRMKVDLEKERLATSAIRTRADRLEKELREARRDLSQAKLQGQVVFNQAGSIAHGVDRLLGL